MIKTILLTLLFILLGIILLINIADFTVKVSMQDGQTTVKAGVWPVLVQIVPGKERPAKSKKEKPAKQKEPRKKKKAAAEQAQEKAKKTPGDVKALIGTVMELVKAVLPPVGYIVGGVRFRHLVLHITVSESDAAQTAIRYGQINALLHGSFPLAQQVFDLKADHLGVSYDFLPGRSQMFFSVEVHLRGARVIWGALKMIVRAIPALLKMKK